MLIVGMFSSFTFLACAPLKKAGEMNESGEGIIGGTDVLWADKINESIVGVYDDAGGQLCTGTLVAQNIVLTAAHCIGYDHDAMYIVFDNLISPLSKMAKAERIEESPYYRGRRFEKTDRNDLALIRFTTPLPKGYKPARFLSGPQNIANGTSVYIAGYGYNDAAKESGQGTLRKTTVKIINAAFGTSEVLVNQTEGSGACHGDSGGPAFIKIKDEYFLWGVTSRGVEDEKQLCNTYAAYTNLFAHQVWINRMVTKLSKSINSF